MQPGAVSKFLGGSHGVPEEELRAIAAAAGEVPFLRESVGQARMDIDEIKAEMAGQTARERDLTSRIAALEAKQQEAARAPDSAAPGSPAAGRAALDKRADRQPAKPAGRLAQEPKDDPRASASISDESAAAARSAAPQATAALAAKTAQKKVTPSASAAIADGGFETGSVAGAQPAVTFGPPVVTPAAAVPPKTYGLQVGTGPSVDALRTIWSSLSVIYSDSLGPMQPRYVSGTDAASGNYDLVVGPVASAGEAKRLCKELTLKGTPCTVGDYTGNAF
jgi:hypothetical protein